MSGTMRRGIVALLVVLVSTLAFAHDTDASALRAQPGESQRRARAAADARSRAIPACPLVTSESSPQGSTTYGHDTAGRRTSMTLSGQPQITYAYDNADRLTTISQASATVGFTYDDVGRTLTSTLPNGVVGTNTYDDASRVASISYARGATQVGELTYTYGKTTVTGTASTNAQQFTGRENDGPLTYYRARYLHPTFGRFISEDPAGFAAGDPNLYAYVGGSPTNATDPSGMIAPIIAACAAGAAFSVAFDLVGNFLGGRKNDLGDLLGSAATGCVAGLAGFGLGRALGGASKALEKAIGKGAGAVAEGAGAAFNIAERQLQSKFLKHAADFGITGPWNKANAQVFREAIGQHVRNAPGTAGSFRGQSGTWYLNPNTRVGVFADEVGNFVTGFRLSDLQLQHFPRLGGG